MNIEGVEIDEKITDLSRKYFSLSEDVPVTTYDGRAFLNASQKAYDVIMVDAYQDITIPFQMSSKEFFALVKSHLKDDGVMVVNMNMRGTKEGNINQYLSDTIGSVFTTEVISRCGGIIQPGTLCVGRSGHRKESDEAYRRTYKCKSEKYDAGSCFKSYRISKRKLYPHR